jgi:hypothetical protein
MINKGAESLPGKDAQNYKQLAVQQLSFRNSTMPKTTRKDSKMQKDYWKLILITQRPIL